MSRLSQKTVSVKQYYYTDPVSFRITDENDSAANTTPKAEAK